jgi:competence ComEA-like helix-hairpin-helix protein
MKKRSFLCEILGAISSSFVGGINYMFGLTLEERKVLIFLLFLVIFGLGIDYFRKTNSSLKIHLEDFVQNIEKENKFDLNEIDKETLIKLPGIGEKIATRIIEYRQRYGGFRDIEELKKIKGLKLSTYRKIKDLLYVK